jgi:DNA primase
LPEQGITKGDLLRYYRDVAPTLLPHIRDRRFRMKRFPDSWISELTWRLASSSEYSWNAGFSQAKRTG